MRKLYAALSLLISPAFFLSSQASAQDAWHRPTTVVGVDKVQCPNASFSSIQDAVNASSPGDLIKVCPGNYDEQVVVQKNLSIHADNGVILIPNNMTANTIGAASGEPVAAVILVKNAEDVQIEGFIADGANSGITECSPRLIGIFYQNASGAVRHNGVRNMNLAPTLNGCQSGDGIDVESSAGGISKVIIEDNSVHDYLKNGITGNEIGTTVTIHENTVTGIGATTGAAQNGIQVGFGAAGTVENNTVTDNVWSPCISLQQCQFNATGLLVYQSDSVTVRDNTVGSNQLNVYIGGNKSRVERNRVFNSPVLVGIELAGNENEATLNRIIHCGQAGLLVQGNNNKVQGNSFTEDAIGILKVAGSTGNILFPNLFFATPVPLQDPAPQTSAQVSPVR